jgi:hypothetical protein
VTPEQRANAIADAKDIAFRFFDAVRRRRAHEVQAIWQGLDPAQQPALAVTLAAAATPVGLKIVIEDEDDGLPEYGAAGRGRGHAA